MDDFGIREGTPAQKAMRADKLAQSIMQMRDRQIMDLSILGMAKREEERNPLRRDIARRRRLKRLARARRRKR